MSAPKKKYYYKSRLRSKGQLTLPAEVRKILQVKEGNELVFYANEKDQIVIEQIQTISPDQAWFWSHRWQEMEQQVQADMAAGRIHRFSNVDEAIKALKETADADDSDHG